MTLHFTEDWFTPYIPNWEKYLIPRLQHHPVRLLEIGSFEGRSATWLLQNVLTYKRDVLTCVDPFTPYEGHGDYEVTFDANMAEIGAGSRLVKIKGSSRRVLRHLPTNHFDGIYIDGSHRTEDVLRDAVLSFDLVRVGGFILFDDYPFSPDREHVVKEAVDAFTSVFAESLRTVFVGWQLMVERTR